MSRFMQSTRLDIPVKEIQGKRVVSYKQIAELHQVDVKNIQMNFKNNRNHFIEGIDYFQFKENSSETKNLLVSRNYFTESGYLMLVKSLTDDLSWDVQRKLVNGYFRMEILEAVLEFMPEVVKKLIYYRGLGLTQTEAGKILDMSEGSVKALEKKLKALGYAPPNLSGKRSGKLLAGYDMFNGKIPEERKSRRRATRNCVITAQMEVEL